MGGELGLDPYARIVQKAAGAIVAGAGVAANVSGWVLAAEDVATGTILRLTSFVAVMIGLHLWFGRREAWIAYVADTVCVAFMGFVLSDWIGLWGYSVVFAGILMGAGRAWYVLRHSGNYPDDFLDGDEGTGQ